MVKISAVIITFNEERNIGRCLDSLAGVADEVVVVDSFSTDRTEQICREKGAHFAQRAFTGYSDQKNFANARASYDYLLSIDADEALSDTLRQAIHSVKSDWRADGYAMNRLTNYCGQWIHHSGWYPDRKLRLFDRRVARWSNQNPHEKIEMDAGARGERLSGDLLHYSYYSVDEHYARARRYAHLAAQAMNAQGKRAALWNLLFSAPVKFLRNYVFRLGFLDGRAGLTICWISALETGWKYWALRRLTNG